MDLQLDHLAFPCVDTEATLRFHLDVMGSTLSWALRTEGRLTMAFKREGGPTIGFTFGDGIQPLGTIQPRGDAPHVGLVVATAAERERWKRHLVEQGIRLTIEDVGPDERIYFADPNGVVFEIEAASPPPSQARSEALEIVRGWVKSPPRAVAETFFSVEVSNMERATAFYARALGAAVSFSSPGWSSLHIAGVRVGLALNPQHAASKIGLHFAVNDLAAARAEMERAGGRIVAPSIEVAPGVVVADVMDTEGNTFTLAQR
jgi:predicted enzyme related to lactoylglutathione lyase